MHKADEVLLVGLADVRKDAYGRTDDLLQGRHLVRFGDTSFKDAQLMRLVDLPHRQWHTHLRVIAFGTTDDVVLRTKQLSQPFFDDGLAVASGDANNGNSELAPVKSRKTLQSF